MYYVCSSFFTEQSIKRKKKKKEEEKEESTVLIISQVVRAAGFRTFCDVVRDRSRTSSSDPRLARKGVIMLS